MIVKNSTGVLRIYIYIYIYIWPSLGSSGTCGTQRGNSYFYLWPVVHLNGVTWSSSGGPRRKKVCSQKAHQTTILRVSPSVSFPSLHKHSTESFLKCSFLIMILCNELGQGRILSPGTNPNTWEIANKQEGSSSAAVEP
jgi:hypothetical protein